MPLALLVANTMGCVSWQPTAVPPAQLRSADLQSTVRVTLAEGPTVELRDPSLGADSIAGTATCAGAGFRACTPTDVAIPLERVREVRTRQMSTTRTTAFVGVLAALGYVFAITFGQSVTPFGAN